MNIWREIKRKCIYLAIFVFERYVDIHLWFQKQEFITSVFQTKTECIEPDKSEWIGIFSLISSSKYELCETYIDDFESIMEECKLFSNIKKDTKIEHLFIAKKNEKYISRSYLSDMEEELWWNKSKVEFTYVEYSHPSMNYTIELNIPDGMWVVGNELFSPAFILRLLKQQSRCYYFDMDYKVNIIDQEIQNFTLSSNNYIYLDIHSYSIRSIHLGK